MRTWRECLIEQINDPIKAIAYLQAILEDYQIYKNPAVVQRSLQTVVEAQGGVSKLAKRVEIEPEVFSNMISDKDIPLIDAIGTVLKTLGYQLSIQPTKIVNANSDIYTETTNVQNTTAQMLEK